MEAIAHARFQRFGARKVAQALKEIRGKTVLEAEELLPMIPRACGGMIGKALRSAAANLTIKAGRAGQKLVPEKVYVKACWSDMGPMGSMRRVMPAPQGRANTFKRKVCHLTVVVSDEPRKDGK
ncbi:MAG: 50S ribosomal protein L22 [Elusimicrobia bacterium]|nr:50S ribosomal protein L22 [Elusimicrobiota bacterium]MDE2238134.1 50S ribosomal protein L22 [Elusimicrobiota bacterium]MDE2425315.1 50S ribosomal protein L22 [Elusimicrobiota bacterium]